MDVGVVGRLSIDRLLPVRILILVEDQPVGRIPGTGRDEAGRNAVLCKSLFTNLQVLLRVQYFDRTRGAIESGSGREAENRLAGLSFFGGDQDHAIRALRAIDGGGVGILEDRDALDVGRVDGSEGAHAAKLADAAFGGGVGSQVTVLAEVVVLRRKGHAVD